MMRPFAKHLPALSTLSLPSISLSSLRLPPLLLPARVPLKPNPELLFVGALSACALVAYFYGVQLVLRAQGRTQSERQRSWVLTAFSSAVMTTLSLPFVGSWYATGRILRGGSIPEYGCAFFVAYLICDLAIGSMHYRGSISMLTGWIHHIVYILLITFVVLPYSFAPLFALCCVLELPTFLLALGSLVPRFRNDYLFAAVFFLTRIVMHIHIGTSLLVRAVLRGETYVPSLVLACILPLHVLWMRDCVAGIVRRRRQRKLRAAGEQGAGAALWLSRSTVWLPQSAVALAASVRARRVAWRRSAVRQRVLRLLHEALAKAEGEQAQEQSADVVRLQQRLGSLDAQRSSPLDAHMHTEQDAAAPAPASVQLHLPDLDAAMAYSGVGVGAGAPRWRSIRRRVAGRIRRSLPQPLVEVQARDAYGGAANTDGALGQMPAVAVVG